MLTTEKLEIRWKDDYLDLLNYARQIGDVEWQNEIIQTLTKSTLYIQQSMLEHKISQLWQRFDAVNRKMLELYKQLSETDNAYVASQLIGEVWGLKQQRVEIGKQLKSTTYK
ncbi:hypothetical protein A8709_05225 [Paenibacillus pectinilyticus]|uniref:Uncharacterized protein n=1 Tax=Paenibacillus pectinilyticus TaxID=512399 RepID=A0A1C0ZSN8_9BACL|nr:hypothetical protein [Paenibacillus pectinilyticus]OCT11095.1 hypothetical protein A8709_05225 [Paenibacillus pectinilyticus]